MGVTGAAGAFAAHHYGKLHVDRTLILKAFAILALGNAVINLLKRTGSTYDHVSAASAAVSHCDADVARRIPRTHKTADLPLARASNPACSRC